MISIHKYDSKRVEDKYREIISELPEQIDRAKKHNAFLRLEGSGLVIAAAAHTLNKDKEQSLMGIRLALQASLAQIKMVQNFGMQIQIEINDDRCFIASQKTENDKISPEDWLSTLDLVLISRDKNALEYLLQFPVSQISRNELPAEEYNYLMVIFWRNLFKNKNEAAESFIAAYKATAPEQVKATELDKVLLIDLPPMDVLSSMLSGNAGEVNTRLEEAVLKHKKFCESNNSYIPFMISTKLSAVSALASDNGFDIKIASGYLPGYFINSQPGSSSIIY